VKFYPSPTILIVDNVKQGTETWTDIRRRESFRFIGHLRGSPSNTRTAAAPTNYQSAPPSTLATRAFLPFWHVGTNFEAVHRGKR